MAVCRSAAETSNGWAAVVATSPPSKLPLLLASKKTVSVNVPASGDSVNCCDSSDAPLPGAVRTKAIGVATEAGPPVTVRGAMPDSRASAARLAAVPARPLFRVSAYWLPVLTTSTFPAPTTGSASSAALTTSALAFRSIGEVVSLSAPPVWPMPV